jgi:hypothetical protein
MVEFGQKLADNRTAEWADFYIRYEKLKHILAKLKAINEKYQELADRDPEAVKSVAKESIRTVPASDQSLENLPHPFSHANPTSSSWAAGADSDMQSELLKVSGNTPPYGSMENESLSAGGSQHGSVSSQGLSEMINRAASGVSDYFDGRKIFERKVREMRREMEKVNFEFEAALLADVDRVNNFYREKLNELTDRLNFLHETVELSRISKTEGKHPEDVEDANYDDDEHIPTLSDLKEKKPLVQSVTHISMKLREHPKPIGPGLDLSEQEEEVMSTLKMNKKPTEKHEKHAHIREADSIQRALVDQYRSSKLLHNFAIMNYTGFVKIVKKHDKINKEHKGRYKQLIRPSNICDEGKAVEGLSEKMEIFYANWFCEGNRREAIAQMLPKRGDGLEMDWSQLRLGYRMGMCTILGLWVCWDCVWGLLSEHSTTIGGRTAFPVFRGCGGLLFLQWFWGMSVWVWTRYRVNYIYLFDLNPRIVASPLSIFNTAVDNTLVFLVLMLLYYKAGAHDIPGKFPAGIFPMLLVIYTVFQLVFPLRTRLPMWENIWKVVTAPVVSPTFFHGYIGDIFTSMVKVFQDMAWTLFFVFSGDWLVNEDLPAALRHPWAKTTYYKNVLIPILTLFPLLIRFNQCLRRYADTGKRFPHLANAFKYALSQTVTLFGAFHPLYLDHNRNQDTNIFQGFWMTAFIGSSLYSFWWDVNMDWGLGKLDYQLLGPRLMYPKRSMYYAIIGLDLVLRFAWVLTLIPPDTGATFAVPHYLTAVSMILELYRRTVWGFLRLENEHRSNTAGFRRVGFVPLHFSTGHAHVYSKEKEHRGFTVLIEIVIITVAVLGACAVSVVAAQRATEKAGTPEL